MLRKLAVFLFLVFSVALLGKGWHYAKDGFSIGRTHFPLEPGCAAEPDCEVASALGQEYKYLGRGHQCYAFESSDGKYVLKLLRYDRYTLPLWLRSCQFSFLDAMREELQSDKNKRLRFMLNSFQIAFDELKEETALIYLHLQETKSLQLKIAVVDRIGRSYPIDLDRTAFVLQRKIPLMMPLFQKSLKRGDREMAKEVLNAFLAVVATRAEKGIFNKDPSFLRNFGYGERGVQIDIGSFYRKPDFDEKEAFAPSFLQTVGHVKQWLSGVDPEIAAWFDHRTEEVASRT